MKNPPIGGFFSSFPQKSGFSEERIAKKPAACQAQRAFSLAARSL
jgi:hypothetical protein